ncbi:protein translocase subunit SecD [Desulfuribacillus stibiiarsenatis]|uniref:protein translocase subunit SecD n=1 Tax=Desulfuribacillus stibiiarsenatis TaxID=1390249 RepID=UPI000A7A10E2|nr:protein translocase subunit SecD [Desulfuribacillus stibiiarsenatis]
MVKWNKLILFVLVTVLIFGITLFNGVEKAKEITLGLDLQGGFEILYQAVATTDTELTNENLQNTVAAIDERINRLGVAEPSIDIEANHRIRVQLAGIENQDEARAIIGTTAKLEFVTEDGQVVMTGHDLRSNAKYVPDEINRPTVSISFKEPSLFAEVTRVNKGKVIAIMLDGDVISAPVVNDVIINGDAVITGMESIAEANRLALLLNSGALPLELQEINSTSVGATLGQIALEKGVYAVMIGAIIIVLYMMLYYRVPGVVAVISLVAYIYLIINLFVIMEFTLTLPGIAAIILGIGMAVDANIITYERVKEEIRNGKTILSSVLTGSKKSLSTILDANITTILAAAILFIFGTGPIKGFALTLIVSIVVSLLTAVLLSRWLLVLLAQSNFFKKTELFGAKGGELK